MYKRKRSGNVYSSYVIYSDSITQMYINYNDNIVKHITIYTNTYNLTQ